MKKIIFTLVLLCVFLLNACGSAGNTAPGTSEPPTSNTTQTTAPEELTEEEIYNAILSKLSKKLSIIIIDDTHLDGFSAQEGMVGIAEIANSRELDLLDKIGYTVTDTNKDGISELLIFSVKKSDDGVNRGDRILCAYTVSDNHSVLLFQGNSSNCYYLLNDATIYNTKFSNGLVTSAGVYQLDSESTALSCVDFYFAVDNTYYQNRIGAVDVASSTALEGGADSFNSVTEGLATQVQSVEPTLISAFVEQ